jgi:hypothetical protein
MPINQEPHPYFISTSKYDVGSAGGFLASSGHVELHSLIGDESPSVTR